MKSYKWICVYQYWTGVFGFQSCHFDFVRAMTPEDLADKLNDQRTKYRDIQILVWAEMQERTPYEYKTN